MQKLLRTYFEYMRTAGSAAVAATAVFSVYSLIESKYGNTEKAIQCFFCISLIPVVLLGHFYLMKFIIRHTEFGAPLKALIEDLMRGIARYRSEISKQLFSKHKKSKKKNNKKP